MESERFGKLLLFFQRRKEFLELKLPRFLPDFFEYLAKPVEFRCSFIPHRAKFMMAITGGSTLSQVWLTYVLTDLDVPKALTLCFSLKKVFTSRKLAVFVSPNLSPAMRELVRHAFDFLFYLEVGLNTAGLTNKEFVKVSAFNLKCFGKVAFLEPTVFAVKNSDDIFDNNQIANCGVLATKSEQDDTQFIDDDLSIFVVKPCLQVFQTLMNSLNTKNGSGNYFMNEFKYNV
ncbi:unnamed protein product [Orchesella dallaii]|uniref:Uncharacterized protein n=1 Tax=Orchesella dallaii TaxID=48710 RepID=A0ABP1RN07_9HEXA